jgi:hypothetical protein
VVCDFSWLWSSFPIFLVVLVRVFPLSILSSPVGDMFRCGVFPRSVLLLLRRRLFRFLAIIAIIVLTESVMITRFWFVTRSGVNSVYYG